MRMRSSTCRTNRIRSATCESCPSSKATTKSTSSSNSPSPLSLSFQRAIQPLLSTLTLLLLSTITLTTIATLPQTQAYPAPTKSKSTPHTKNVAILLSSSSFYHNYRHSSNVLSIYQSLKQYGGFTDDNIILFLADEIACNARNPFKNTIYNRRFNEFRPRASKIEKNLYTSDIQVDYSGPDVTVENFFRVLLGRHVPYTPSQQKIGGTSPSPSDLMDEDTNLFIFLTGHGGDEFFKFRDTEEFLRHDLRSVFLQMQLMKRFKNILFVSDTCQAFSLAPNDKEEDDVDPVHGVGDHASLRNVYSIGSSLRGQSSYAYTSEVEIGHSIIDRYTHHFSIYLDKLFENDAISRKEEIEANREYYGDAIEEYYANDYYYNEEDEEYTNPLEHVSIKEAMVDSMYSSEFTSGASILGRSDVGFTDKGCDRRMSQVPLSDFFVMKKTNEEVVVLDELEEDLFAYGDGDENRGEEESVENVRRSNSSAPTSSHASSSLNELRECVDETADRVNGQCRTPPTSTSQQQQPTKEKEFITARHPADLTFVLSVISLMAIVRLSSRIW